MGDAARKLDQEQCTELRGAPRARVHVVMDVFSEHNFWSGLTMDMSEGGVFVATHHVLPPGALLELHMTLPFESEPLVLLAEVRWTRDYTRDGDVPPGLGLRFVDADAEALEKIRNYVSTVRDPLYFES